MSTLVLVHSPITGPLVWSSIADDLRHAGFDVKVPNLRDNGRPPFWQQHAESVAAAIAGVEGQIVLVGHSGAGMLLPAIARAAEQLVSGYLFVDAGIPVEGDTRVSALEREDADTAAQLHSLLSSGGRFPTWDEDDLADLVSDEGLRRALVAGLRPRGADFFEEPIPVPESWPDAPCAYLQFSAAYDVPAAIARDQGWPMQQVSGGHFHMLEDPAAVTAAISQLAHALGV